MFVEKLTLKNFRKYKELEVDFKNRLTIIVGENGSGKTTILDALALSLSSFLKSLSGEYGLDIKKNDVRICCKIIGSTPDFQPQYPVEIELGGVFENEKIVSGQSMDADFAKIKMISSPFFTKLKSELSNGEKISLPIIAYYGAGRLWNSEGINELTETVSMRQNGYNNCLNAHLDSKSMNTWFEKMTYIELQSKTENNLLSAVRFAIEKSFSLITDCSEVKVQSNLFNHELEISYKDRNNKYNKLLMSQLSAGYRCTTILVADIAYRMATLNPHFEGNISEKTEGVILIDEVDLHLHPEWQQNILSVLATVFPKLQFIVTTHAPAVINSVKSESLIILNGEELDIPATETYGRDMNFITQNVMGVSERPREVKELFEKFENYLEDKRFEDARNMINELEDILVTDDSELASCKVRLEFEEDLEN